MKYSILTLILFLSSITSGLAAISFNEQIVPLLSHAVETQCTSVKDCSQHITAHSHLICKNNKCRSKCNTGYLATAKGKCTLIICNPAKCTQEIPKKSHHTCDIVKNKCSYACNADHTFNGVSCVTKKCKLPSSCLSVPQHSTATCVNSVCSFSCNENYFKDPTGKFCKKSPNQTCTAASQCSIKGPAHSSVYCTSGSCGIACNSGFQFSSDKSSCVPNITHCKQNTCQKINSGQVKCKNSTCVYSCNALAGYSLHYTGTTPTCYNYSKNNNNCGSFGNICASGKTCVKGVCTAPKMRRDFS